MKCSQCGNELNSNERYCSMCGTPVDVGSYGAAQPDSAWQGTAAQPDSAWQGTAAQQDPAWQGTAAQPDPWAASPDGGMAGAEPPKSRKKTGIVIGCIVAAAIAVGGLVFAMNREDPKEVVIHAFENIYTDDQVNPMEELFGGSAFAEKVKTADAEASMTVVIDSCSDADVNQFAGSGFRIEGKYDKTNQRGAANIGVIYKDMDLANVDAYLSKEIFMMALPELSSRVFTIDLSDGLLERIEHSPLLGPAIQEQGIDIQGIADYLEDVTAEMESGGQVLDFDTLMTRYREGTQAQEKFKEALAVEKGEKGTFFMDGKEVECRGYQVTVSKDSMVEFLSTTIDFFLNDQELKDMYLAQLERSVRMAELVGGSYPGVSAAAIYNENMEDVKEAVEEMIDFLDKSLTDATMKVYVDKKGRLAAVIGTTAINSTETGETVNADFDVRLQGGSYLTQNLTAEVVLTSTTDQEAKLSVIKEGTYDGKQLTCDLTADVSVDGTTEFDGGFVWTGTYNSDGGDYDLGLSVTADRSLIVDMSMTGVVDELEKGTLLHTDIDQLKIEVMDGMESITFSGEYFYGPLSEPVEPLEGEQFDMVAADEGRWESVIMEMYMGLMRLMNQLSL